MAESLGTAVVAEDVAEAGEIPRATPFALLIVGAEVISVETSAVAGVVVIIAAVETSGVAAEVVVLRALESLSEYYCFHGLFPMICLCISRTITLTSKSRSEGKPITPPDATVVKTEDAVAKALVASRQKNAKNATQAYPDRPGYGTLGRPVTLYANYLPFTSVGKLIFRYHVSIAAEGGREPGGRKARHIVRLLLEEHYCANLNSIATDYRSTLISVTKVAEGQFDVRYKDENDEEYPENPKVYKVTIQHTGDINPADLINYLTSTNAGSMLSSMPEIVQALNVILGHHPKSERSVASIGGNRHFSLQEGLKESSSLEGGLEVLRGFFVSVRAATARVLLNVQVKYLACYKSGPLEYVIQEWKASNFRASSYRMEAFLKRMRVCITHIKHKGKNGKERPARIKTISGLATPQDGSSAPNGPKVEGYGAGPYSVKFFLNAPGSQSARPSGGEGKGKKGKKGKKGPPKAGPLPAGQYISVADFFRKGEPY